MNNCRWVLANGSYCEAKVKYRMVRDDDQNLVRKYNPFCPDHMSKWKQQLEEIDDEEE